MMRLSAEHHGTNSYFPLSLPVKALVEESKSMQAATV
jgi:hypothetical protein